MHINARRGDITGEEGDAIVNPSNSYGVMGGGVAGMIKKKGGQCGFDHRRQPKSKARNPHEGFAPKCSDIY